LKRLLLLFFLLYTGIAFGQSNFKLNIDSLAVVSLPGKPASKKNDTGQIYFYKKYASEYIVLLQNFKYYKKFSLQKDSLSAFYEGVVEGHLRLPHSKLLSKNEVTINSFKAIDFSYKADSTHGLPDVRFQRAIFLDHYMITFSYWTSSDSLQKNLPNKEAFFNSIAIIADKDKTKQYTDEGMAYNLGIIIGKYLTIPFVVIIGLLIVFLIRRVAYKKII
jgi:hypothetical protein